jgi:NADH:ubiquinone oxidoreductase subunit 6 (subunit J)
MSFYFAHYSEGLISGIIYAGYIAMMFFAVRMLPNTPRAKTLKTVFNVWIVLTAIWMIVKPYFRAP